MAPAVLLRRSSSNLTSLSFNWDDTAGFAQLSTPVSRCIIEHMNFLLDKMSTPEFTFLVIVLIFFSALESPLSRSSDNSLIWKVAIRIRADLHSTDQLRLLHFRKYPFRLPLHRTPFGPFQSPHQPFLRFQGWNTPSLLCRSSLQQWIISKWNGSLQSWFERSTEQLTNARDYVPCSVCISSLQSPLFSANILSAIETADRKGLTSGIETFGTPQSTN